MTLFECSRRTRLRGGLRGDVAVFFVLWVLCEELRPLELTLVRGLLCLDRP